MCAVPPQSWAFSCEARAETGLTFNLRCPSQPQQVMSGELVSGTNRGQNPTGKFQKAEEVLPPFIDAPPFRGK